MESLPKLLKILTLAAVVLGAAIVIVNSGLIPLNYDWTTVSIHEKETNAKLGELNVRVADTEQKRYTGLSNTKNLSDNEGMLFIHDTEGEQAYVMRDMSFPIDIIFINSNGEITKIHHAETESEDSSPTLYRGTGKYVLETKYNYTKQNHIHEGDKIISNYNVAQ